MSRVVNLRKAPYDVYIGRAGKGQDGYFGNPVVVGKECPICTQTHTSGGTTLPCYAFYLRARCAKDQQFREAIERLRGQTLGCFCAPNPCHGHVIIEYLKGNL